MAEETTNTGTTFIPPPDKDKPKRKKATVKKTEKAVDVDFTEIKKEEPKKVDSEKIDLDKLKQEKKDEHVSINFMDDDFVSEDLNKQTKKSEAPTNEEIKEQSHKSIKDVQQEIKELEDDKNKDLKPQDYEEISSLIINIIDFLMSALLKWWAKDSSDTAYSLNEQKKKTLSSQLSLILIKHQQKWSIEFLFLLTIIAIYSGPVMAAKANRKNPSDRKAGRPPKK